MNIILKSGKTCNLLLTPTHKNEHKKKTLKRAAAATRIGPPFIVVLLQL